MSERVLHSSLLSGLDKAEYDRVVAQANALIDRWQSPVILPTGWARPKLPDVPYYQLKHFDEQPILCVLYLNMPMDWTFDNMPVGMGRWDHTILHAFPVECDGTMWKMAIRKMASLIDRRLVDGCGCGCRGDYKLTAKGKTYYEEKYSVPAQAPVHLGSVSTR